MITIVIPAYNAEQYLAETLNSVLAQSLTDWEAVVVDDGSADSTCDIARSFAESDSRFRLLRQSNGGPSKARNCGAAVSDERSSEIIFLDADDLWLPETLEILHARLASNPTAAAAYGLAVAVDRAGRLIGDGMYEAHQRRRIGVSGGKVVEVSPDSLTTFACEIVTELIVTCGTVLIRRSAYEKIDGWADDLSLWEDWDLWLRLTRVGGFAFVDRPVLHKREHCSNLSADWFKVEVGERAVRSRLLNSLNGDPALLSAARLGAAYHHRRIITDKVEWARAAASKGDFLSALKQIRHIVRLWSLGPVK